MTIPAWVPAASGMIVGIIFSQAPATTTGIELSGWVGTGLLGAVLGWVFYRHLPDKDKQINSLIADKDRQIGELITRTDARLDASADRHDKAQQALRADLIGVFVASLDRLERRVDAGETKLFTVLNEIKEGLDELLEQRQEPKQGGSRGPNHD